MFDISWTEFLLIGVVALIVIGPKELPAVLRTLGQWTRRVRSMAADFQGQFQEAMREAEMADLKKQVDDIAHGHQELRSAQGCTRRRRSCRQGHSVVAGQKPALMTEPAIACADAVATATGPVTPGAVKHPRRHCRLPSRVPPCRTRSLRPPARSRRKTWTIGAAVAGS